MVDASCGWRYRREDARRGRALAYCIENLSGIARGAWLRRAEDAASIGT